MNKHFLMITLTLLLTAVSSKAEKFEFLNKLNVPVEFTIGTRNTPPQPPLATLNAGEKYSLGNVNTANNVQLMFREKGKPEISYIYEFTPKAGKNIYVRILESSKGISFEPQTFVLNNLDKADIKLVRTVGAPRPAAKPQAGPTYYDDIGVKSSATEAEVNTACRKTMMKYHPDKNPGNKAAEDKFKQINNQCEVLRDSNKRKQYNRTING